MRVTVRLSGTDRIDHVPVDSQTFELQDAPYSVLGGLSDCELMHEVYAAVSFWASEGVVCGEETLTDGSVIVGGVA